MISKPSSPTIGDGPTISMPSRPTIARVSRAGLTYIVPALAVLYVVLAGLWLVPDGFAGMYGNRDGHWSSWLTRGIMEWSGFLDFSPFSPLTGTGSPFLPNLPWLNPGALALAIPASLPLRHLASMLIYLAELTATLYLLYRNLEFSREQSFFAAILYVCLFFIPFWGTTGALPWYSLQPLNAHLTAAMNVATIALIRVGYERHSFKLVPCLAFLAALFVAFASAPMTSLTYIPTYGALWLIFLIPPQAQRHAILWRWGTIAFASLVFGSIGVPRYLAAWIAASARGASAPPIFHPGWKLVSPMYWWELLSAFPACSAFMQLICPSTIVGWFEIAALGGGLVLALLCSGMKRRYGLVTVTLIVMLHVYALLYSGMILGRLHVVSPPFLMWAFSPLAPPAVIAGASLLVSGIVGRRAVSAWLPAAAGCLVAVVAVVAWIRWILPNQPRVPGDGPLGLPPIAHLPARKGPIVEYLQQQIGLMPDKEFRGYATTFLAAPDGLARKSMHMSEGGMTYDMYIASQDILLDRFGNSFQKSDLWDSDIPTLEEYGQSISRQLHYFARDLLAEPQDQIDPYERHILLYRFRPLLLRALGVRFVIADSTLNAPSIQFVITETGKAGAAVNLYEIKGANLGQFSPTQVTWAEDYTAAVRALREHADFERRVVLLGAPARQPDLSSASRAELVVLRDGYRLRASARGRAMVVLPVQFSHCWQIDNATDTDLPRVFRANLVQTGVIFKDDVDVVLRFNFEPWTASCRLQDARDLALFSFR